MTPKSQANFDKQLLSNYSNDKRLEIETILKEYKENGGTLKVFIKDKAYWNNGTLDPNRFALCTLDKSKDHSEFWDFVRNRKE